MCMSPRLGCDKCHTVLCGAGLTYTPYSFNSTDTLNVSANDTAGNSATASVSLLVGSSIVIT